MSFLSQNNHWIQNYYRLSHDIPREMGEVTDITTDHVIYTTYSDEATEMLNEEGTTFSAIGDVTAEIMLTTPGKIPNEMYDLEDTSTIEHKTETTTIEQTYPTMAITTEDFTDEIQMINTDDYKTTTEETEIEMASGFTTHSTIFVILAVVLVTVILLCCIIAYCISRARRQNCNYFNKDDIECDPECIGVSQPLLSSDKGSESTSKTSASSKK